MGSQLSLLQVPPPTLGAESAHNTQHSAVALGVARVLGKVSRAPVADVAAAQTTAVAAGGRAVATWDLVAGVRARHLDAPQEVARCAFVAPQLVAAVGEACAVHLWDVRAASAAPTASIRVARDNLYALAARDGRVFCGGADGAVHHVDIRAQRAHRWTIPGAHGAVLDMAAVDSAVVAVMEAGAVVAMPESGRHLLFEEKLPPFHHRAVADVEETELGMRVAVGDNDGQVHLMDRAGGTWCRREWRVAPAGTRVPVVRRAGAALYACAGERVYRAA